MKKLLPILMFLLGILPVLNAQKLTLHGKVESQGKNIANAKIEVIENNEIIYTTTTLTNGGYKLNLELESIYNISYSHDGHIQKSIEVNTRSKEANHRYFYQLDIELYKIGEEKDDENLLPPVAKLYMKDNSSGFTYDKKYVKWVQEEYKEIREQE